MTPKNPVSRRDAIPGCKVSQDEIVKGNSLVIGYLYKMLREAALP